MREPATIDTSRRPAADLPASSRAAASPAVIGAPIVVAAGAGHGSDAALTLAYRLAGAMAADVRVVAAVEPPIVLDPYMGPVTFPLDAAPWMRDCRTSVHRQLARTGLTDAGWPVDVVVGEPARRIAARLRETDARLVLLGRVRHGSVADRYRSRLALRLLRLTDAPVLAVVPTLAALPRRVVVGVDFSPYSTYAARIALSLAAPYAVVHLVHVRPRHDMALPLTETSPESGDDEALAAAWRGALDEIGETGGRQIETVTIVGDPRSALINYARADAADLVATGTHGRGFIDRLFLGSVAESLLQHAPCSVLCVPGSAVARAEHRRRAIAGMHTRAIPAEEWDVVLAQLTRGAAGRPCVVEVDHPEMGAQQLVDGLPFAGASYDPVGDSLVLTFGIGPRAQGSPGELVLTHAMRGVRRVDVISDASDSVHVLRVAGDDDGQTLVTFTA